MDTIFIRYLQLIITVQERYEEIIKDELKNLVIKNTTENDRFSGLVVWTTRGVFEKANLNGLELDLSIF